MRLKLETGELVEITVKKGEKENVFEYYVGSVKIGVLDTSKMYDNILVIEKMPEKIADQIKDTIDDLPREVIEQEAEETKDIEDYINERYGELEEVGEIRKIDIRDEEEKAKEDHKTEREDEKQEKVPTTSDIAIKQSIDLDERANDMHSVKQWLGGTLPQEITRIGVVESYQMREYGGKNTTRYSLVAISKDGTVEPLEKYVPQLKQRDSSGDNPTKESYQVGEDGSVEQDAPLSEFELGNKIIQLDNKEMGRIELSIGQEARSSNDVMTTRVRDDNTTWVIDKSTRSVIGEYEANGEDTVEENIQEAETHQELNPDCDQLREEDVDGDLTTKSHIHENDTEVVLSNGEKVTFERLAIRWGLYDDNGSPDSQKARDEYMEMQEKDIEAKPDDIIEEIDEEMEDPRVRNSREN